MLLRHAIVALGVNAFIAGAQAQQQQKQQAPQQQQAQPNVQLAVSGWQVQCNNNGSALDCRAYIDAVRGEKRQVVTSIAVRYVADAKKPVIIIQVPLGILVTEPITLTVDNEPPERFTIETCTPVGCFAGTATTDALMAKMRAGKEINVVFANLNKQPVTVTLPLAGFGVAYDKVKG